MKVLILAFCCEPGQGSEAGTAWQWATRLSVEHDVMVITHPVGRTSIEREQATGAYPNLRFSYVRLPSLLDPFRNGERAIRFKYVLWQLVAWFMALGVRQSRGFDLVHHVSWGTLTGPTLGWALGRPFVWGPIGGGQQAPRELRQYLGRSARFEYLRNLRVKLARYMPWIRFAASRSAAILATNIETMDFLRSMDCGPRLHFMLDSAIDPDWAPEQFPARAVHSPPIVIWTGRLEPHKAPQLAIQAFAIARKSVKAKLWFFGSGPLLKSCQDLAEELEVAEDVQFFGKVPHSAIPARLSESDVFLFTSIRDSFGPSVLEAMALGLPVVTLDHQGMRMMPDSAVRKVSVTDSTATATALGKELVELLESEELRGRMGRAAYEYVRREHLWTNRLEVITRLYQEIMDRRTHGDGEGNATR